jgi:hypothetical protein
MGSCKTCPPGTWTVEEGSKSEHDCIPVCGYGTYSPSGLVPCLECPQSSYTGEPPFDGFKECTACPADLFTFQPGAQGVSQCRAKCAPGTYSDTGLAPCAPCPLNFFQPLSGQRQCFECHTTEETLKVGTSSKDECQDVTCPDGICEHGGLCVAVNHRPKCFCPAGFTGANCETNVNECDSNPCYNGGDCVDLPQGYRCDCKPGYSGLQCIEEESSCASNPCPDRAMCRNEPGVGNFTCLCRSGYTGPTCNQTVDPCTANGNPCRNEGVCESFQQVHTRTQTKYFQCTQNPLACTSSGRSIPSSATVDLEQSHYPRPVQMVTFRARLPSTERVFALTPTCGTTPLLTLAYVCLQGRYFCTCPAGWEGVNCEQNIDDCAELPCLLGANCTDLVNDFSCECPTGFTGKRCQLKVDLCERNECVNGYCVDKLFRYE